LNSLENAVVNHRLNFAPPQLRNACIRLIKRAENDARDGNPRLLEAITEVLKPRVQAILTHMTYEADKAPRN
jgi:hypothetical protein